MSFFVDSNVIVYAAAGTGSYAGPCGEAIAAVARGAEGRTSTAVLEEVWHLELSGRVGRVAGLAARALTVFSPTLAVTEEVLRAALELDAPGLGANDRVHAATCIVNGIDSIVTADGGFDSVAGLRRVDPLDGRALSALVS